MKTIRRGVFETNSSSTHSISIVAEEDFERWRLNKNIFKVGDKFVEREEAIEELRKNEWFIKYHPDFDFTDEELVDETFMDYGFTTYADFLNEDLESFVDSFTTKSGDKIVAFGSYGYNG